MPMIGQQDIFSNLLKGHGAASAPFHAMLSVVQTHTDHDPQPLKASNFLPFPGRLPDA